jgi:hypothetical protein
VKIHRMLLKIADELDRGAQLRSAHDRTAPIELGDVAAAIRCVVAKDQSVRRSRWLNECTLQVHSPQRSTTDEQENDL